MPVKNGDKVKVNYKGTLDDGTVFDTSEGKAPIEFEVGAKKVIPGFENAILGMNKGDEKKIKLKPEEAYGILRPELVKKIPRTVLPKDQEPKPGMMMLMKTKEGVQIPARIKEVTDKDITIDLNHPLAGKTLNFKIKVIDITS
ncbi:peptidylprolyl isomerase [Candidatus Woesearchaeota archaeon]|nr:peptidylprolyl isomerase [Candidatus Woesearchaeota archaeon]